MLTQLKRQENWLPRRVEADSRLSHINEYQQNHHFPYKPQIHHTMGQICTSVQNYLSELTSIVALVVLYEKDMTSSFPPERPHGLLGLEKGNYLSNTRWLCRLAPMSKNMVMRTKDMISWLNNNKPSQCRCTGNRGGVGLAFLFSWVH